MYFYTLRYLVFRQSHIDKSVVQLFQQGVVKDFFKAPPPRESSRI